MGPVKVDRYRLGLVVTTASAVAWSTAGFFTRLVATDGWTMLAWRGVFGALGIALAMLAHDRAGFLRGFSRLGLPGWSFAAVSAVGMVFFITALKNTSVAHVAVIYAVVPFVAAILGWLLIGERPAPRSVAASLAALLGVVVMVGFGGDGRPFGDLLAFGMTLAMAMMMVIARRFAGIPVMQAACLSALLSGLACWPAGEPMSISGHEFLILVLFGLVNSALGLALFTFGSRLLPPIETALIGSLDAPLAPLWVWLAFGERPDAGTVAGGAIVFAAVACDIVAGARSRRR